MARVAMSEQERELRRRAYMKKRRRKLWSDKRCICGPIKGYVGRDGVVHGRVVLAGKCQRCIDVHTKNARSAAPAQAAPVPQALEVTERVPTSTLVGGHTTTFDLRMMARAG